MISKVSVTNFKCHAQTEIELGRVAALVGPNGCGKTAILQAIYYFSQLADRSFGQVFRGEHSLDHLVKRGCTNLQVMVKEENEARETKWMLSLTSVLKEQNGLHKEWSSEAEWQWNNESGKRELEQNHSLLNVPTPVTVINALGNVVYFKPNYAKLSAPSYPVATTPQIELDGSGLATAVAYLMTSKKEQYKSIEIALREVVPAVSEIGVRKAEMTALERGKMIGDELVFDTTSAKEVPAHAMSEGTLLTLGILTLLWNPTSPSLILLDDVEQGLHPLAQRKLMQVLKKFAEDQKRQIWLTSHSPYIVDELEAKDVWVMATDQSGTSHTKRLSDHPDAKRLLSVLTTGEFASAVGEDWVGGDAAPVEEVNA